MFPKGQILNKEGRICYNIIIVAYQVIFFCDIIPMLNNSKKEQSRKKSWSGNINVCFGWFKTFYSFHKLLAN